ncbi:S-layer homology domain-containing protein [Brevibacillus ginsengisoli]|uniref:S-layer homology domain-containing protein n=1 Tax=Brevibacillus ginsengisoli TaxID=363854 RepID=UPI003CE99CF0
MKNKWLLWLTCALLFFSGWTSYAGAGLALESESSIQVAVHNEKLTITGKTDLHDPLWVPLMVQDAAGQILYFQDVSGAGKPFEIEVEIPSWAAYGTAEAVLYSTVIARDRFSIEKNQGGKSKMNVSVRIAAAGGDEILKWKTFSVSKQSSVYNLLRVAAEENGFDYEVRDPENDGEQVYLIGIDGLKEFDKGPGSGWVYKVNGTAPPTSMDRCILQPGDKVEFLYTTDLGVSENAGSGNSSIGSSYEVDSSQNVSSAISQLELAEDVNSIVSITKKLLWDLSDYSIEKQKTYVADVGVFLQAAYEHAAKLQVKKSEVTKPLDPDYQELTGLKVKEALQEQDELKQKLEELLEDSTLYKSLLQQLKPVLLVPYPTNSASQVMKLYVDRDARDRIRDAHASIAMVKGDLRANLQLRPEEPSSKETMWFSVRSYSDQEQTAQFDEWQKATNTELAPLTGSYRVEASHPDTASIELKLPITGALDDTGWPTLFQRDQTNKQWTPVIKKLHYTKQRIMTPLKFGTDLVVVNETHEFEDVHSLDNTKNNVQEAIAALYGWGIVQGTSTDNFGVNQPLTRAEFFAMLKRMTESRMPSDEEKATSSLVNSQTAPVFQDVPANSWYAPVVKYAVQKGWASGRGKQLFAPQAPMTRSEVAVLLTRLYETDTHSEDLKAEMMKDEREIPTWASHGVRVAAAHQWLTSDANGNIRANANITRGEAAYAVYQYYLTKYLGDDK